MAEERFPSFQHYRELIEGSPVPDDRGELERALDAWDSHAGELASDEAQAERLRAAGRGSGAYLQTFLEQARQALRSTHVGAGSVGSPGPGEQSEPVREPPTGGGGAEGTSGGAARQQARQRLASAIVETVLAECTTDGPYGDPHVECDRFAAMFRVLVLLDRSEPSTWR